MCTTSSYHDSRLECQLLKSQVYALWLALIGGWVLMGSVFYFTGTAVAAPETPVVVTTRKLIITDSHNRNRIVLDAAADTPRIAVYDNAGRPAILMEAEGGGTPLSTGIKIFDAQGTPSVLLGMLTANKPQTAYPGILLQTSRNSSRVHLSLGPGYCEPSLLMRDATGTKLDLGIWFLDRRPYLKLYDAHGSPRAALCLDGHGDAALQLKKRGEAQVRW